MKFACRSGTAGIRYISRWPCDFLLLITPKVNNKLLLVGELMDHGRRSPSRGAVSLICYWCGHWPALNCSALCKFKRGNRQYRSERSRISTLYVASSVQRRNIDAKLIYLSTSSLSSNTLPNYLGRVSQVSELLPQCPVARFSCIAPASHVFFCLSVPNVGRYVQSQGLNGLH